MNNKNQFDNISEEIQRALRQARDSMNYGQLNQTLRNSVDEVLREVRRSAEDVQRTMRGGTSRGDGWTPFSEQHNTGTGSAGGSNVGSNTDPKQQWYTSYGSHVGDYTRQYQEKLARDREAARQRGSVKNLPAVPEKSTLLPPSLVSRNPAGKISGVLYTVFGGIGFGTFSVLSLVFGVLWAAGVMTLSAGASTAGIFIPLALAGGFFLGKGVGQRKRLGRFRKYVTALDDKRFADVRTLADSTGHSESFVQKDLKKMVALDMFPEGKVSDDGKYFLVDQETYQQYQTVMEQQRRKQEEKDREDAARNDPAQRELQKAIDEGRSYIRQIREANDAIPGELISRKLDRLEAITEKIFARVEGQPEQLPELRRLMEYYLPTTMKLVNTYREFDAQPVQGENIKKAKAEIEETLDTINDAYEKLFDSLFQDVAMDVSADISVLQTLLAQEGLTGDDFRKEN